MNIIIKNKNEISFEILFLYSPNHRIPPIFCSMLVIEGRWGSSAKYWPKIEHDGQNVSEGRKGVGFKVD